MAPNGIVSRKSTSISPARHDLLLSLRASSSDHTGTAPATAGQSESISLDSLFADWDDEVPAPVIHEDAKKKLPQVKNPGNWNSEIVGAPKPKDSSSKTAPPPAMNKLPSTIARAFPNGKPMADKPKSLKCNHCKRAVSKHSMPKHIEGCLNKKQEKQRKKKEAKDARDAAARKEKAGDSDEEEDDGAKKTASKTGLTASKKRKAADEGEDGAPTKKKKKKDEPKAKAARPKAPVDVEKQCGVELPQGGQCARSLTCKSHSMGAKRAVPGRSAPYDKLLMDYQRKNQAKMQKAAFDANAPNPDDDSLPTGPIDSEEEKDLVMSAIQRSWGGQPIYQPVYVPLRKKYEYNRLKGILQSTFAGRGGGSIFGTGMQSGGGFFGSNSSTAPTVDADGMIHARRPSVAPGARSMMAPSRKPSVAT